MSVIVYAVGNLSISFMRWFLWSKFSFQTRTFPAKIRSDLGAGGLFTGREEGFFRWTPLSSKGRVNYNLLWLPAKTTGFFSRKIFVRPREKCLPDLSSKPSNYTRTKYWVINTFQIYLSKSDWLFNASVFIV